MTAGRQLRGTRGSVPPPALESGAALAVTSRWRLSCQGWQLTGLRLPPVHSRSSLCHAWGHLHSSRALPCCAEHPSLRRCSSPGASPGEPPGTFL